MAHYKVDQDDWLTVYLKYLLAVFNFFFWVSEPGTCHPLLQHRVSQAVFAFFESSLWS